MSRLSDRIADTLTGDAAGLAARWRERARAAAARQPDGESASDTAIVARAELVVKTIGAMLRNHRSGRDALAVHGWEIGTLARDGGASLHQLLRELELLGAMLLHTAERIAAESPDEGLVDRGASAGTGAAAGLRVARRIGEAMSLLTTSAAEGWVHGLLEGSRKEMRVLRHDLRNPLGTVRSALSLMDDASLPEAIRASPRYRTMALRNATALDALIRRRLGDAALRDWVRIWPEVSLERLALAVRRDLRGAVEARDCAVVVGDGLPVVSADSAALELILGAALAALVEQAALSSRIAIELAARRDDAVVLAVTIADAPEDAAHGNAARAAVSAALDASRELAARAGVRVWAEDALFVEIPVSVAEARDDVRGARQRQDA